MRSIHYRSFDFTWLFKNMFPGMLTDFMTEQKVVTAKELLDLINAISTFYEGDIQKTMILQF